MLHSVCRATASRITSNASHTAASYPAPQCTQCATPLPEAAPHLLRKPLQLCTSSTSPCLKVIRTRCSVTWNFSQPLAMCTCQLRVPLHSQPTAGAAGAGAAMQHSPYPCCTLLLPSCSAFSVPCASIQCAVPLPEAAPNTRCSVFRNLPHTSCPALACCL